MRRIDWRRGCPGGRFRRPGGPAESRPWRKPWDRGAAPDCISPGGAIDPPAVSLSPLRGCRYERHAGVPRLHAVGYFLAPLRDSSSPRVFRLTLMGDCPRASIRPLRDPYRPKAERVAGPTMPSTVRPFCCWNCLTAASVLARKFPSTVTGNPAFTRAC